MRLKSQATSQKPQTDSVTLVLCQSISDKQGKLDANVSSQTMIFAAEAEILSVKFLDDDTYITLIALSGMCIRVHPK